MNFHKIVKIITGILGVAWELYSFLGNIGLVTKK